MSNELQGWKEIAQYLGKSVRAVQRWETELGLPVHRIKTSGGQTIYARADEIDAWRANHELPPKARTEADGVHAEASEPAATASRSRYGIAAAVVLMASLAMLLLYVSTGQSADTPVSYELTTDAFLVKQDGGIVRRHRFQKPIQMVRAVGMGSTPFPLERIHRADVDGDGVSEVLVVVTYATDGQESDELYCFSSGGDVKWVYRPELKLEFRAGMFQAPWYITAVAVSPEGPHASVYLTLTHNFWWPSALVRIRGNGTAETRLVHAGHLYAVQFFTVNGVRHVATGGINNEYAAASLAVLREDGGPVASPQATGSQYECADCGDQRPVRYFVFERSELNRFTDAPYNRVAGLSARNGNLSVFVEEHPERGRAATVLTFSPALEMIEAAAGDGYWQAHDAEHQAGRLTHRSEDCAARAVQFRVFDRAAGWVSGARRYDGPVPGSTR